MKNKNRKNDKKKDKDFEDKIDNIIEKSFEEVLSNAEKQLRIYKDCSLNLVKTFVQLMEEKGLDIPSQYHILKTMVDSYEESIPTLKISRDMARASNSQGLKKEERIDSIKENFGSCLRDMLGQALGGGSKIENIGVIKLDSSKDIEEQLSELDLPEEVKNHVREIFKEKNKDNGKN